MSFQFKYFNRPSLLLLVINVVYISTALGTIFDDKFIELYTKDCDTSTKDEKTVDPKKLIVHWLNTHTGVEKQFDIEEANDLLYHDGDFNPDFKFYFYVPDFASSPGTVESNIIRKQFIKLKDVNFFIIDSSMYTGLNELDIAASLKRAFANCYIIGKYIGEFLGQAKADGVKLELIHLFGQGLGAPICGHAARAYEKLTSEKLKRVSGLDPAGGCFDNASISDVLSKADAAYVDIYHTNIGQYGTTKFLGHASFFPNGGKAPQPGCIQSDLLSWGCSHVNTPATLWAESAVRPGDFLARKCDSWDQFDSGMCSGEIIKAGVESSFHEGNYYLKMTTPFISQFGESVATKLSDVLFHQLLGL